MSGAGGGRAGSPWAGHLAPGASYGTEPMALAPAYDPEVRAIPQNADGTTQTVHWVDQAVAVCLGNALGDIPARPETGVDYAKLKGATADNLVTVLSDAVNVALASLLARRAISITYVRVLRAGAGSTVYEVGYKNLVAPSGTGDRTFRKASA